MASLRRITHKSGRVVYRIVICLGYDAQGHKLVKNLTYSVNQSATRKQQEQEARKYAMDMEDRMKYGWDLQAPKLSFEEFAGKWLMDVKGRLAYGTYVGYEQLLRSRILPYFKTYKLACVGTADIEAFYGTLADTYSTGTIRRYANVLSSIFSAARRWGMMEGNPCRDARKPRKKQEEGHLRYFTPQESLLFLKSLELTYELSCRRYSRDDKGDSDHRTRAYMRSYKVPIQFKVFFTLSMFCGFRRGETLALCWEDIDMENLEISISKAVGRTEKGFACKEPKNSSALRKVPFPESIKPLLLQYQAEYEIRQNKIGDAWQGTGNLFIQADGKRMGHTTVYQYFVRHLERYNRWISEYPAQAAEQKMTQLPRIPLHGLRHSCATLLNYLDVNMVDISKYLGHSSCSTTMNIYAHSFEKQRRVASERLDEFIRTNI